MWVEYVCLHTMMYSHTPGDGMSVAGPVSMLVLAVGLVVTAADLPMAWLVWPLGYGVVLPLAIGYAKRDTKRETDEPDQLAELQDRYVEGEVSEAEFEAELESVLAEGEEKP